MDIPVRRGSVYFVDFSPTRGSEQDGRRPAVVVSNEIANLHSSVVTVVAVTHTTPKKKYPQNVNLLPGMLDDRGGTILCSQLLTVSKERLMNYMATLPPHVMNQVDQALRHHLQL